MPALDTPRSLLATPATRWAPPRCPQPPASPARIEIIAQAPATASRLTLGLSIIPATPHLLVAPIRTPDAPLSILPLRIDPRRFHHSLSPLASCWSRSISSPIDHPDPNISINHLRMTRHIFLTRSCALGRIGAATPSRQSLRSTPELRGHASLDPDLAEDH